MSNIINLIDWTKTNTVNNEKLEDHASELRRKVREHVQQDIAMGVNQVTKQIKSRRKKSA